MTFVRLQNVTVRFESGPVLREVFFRLQKGDRAGLIGKNGTGKTTLLKLILGQTEPTEGTVEVFGKARIGYFSQFSELDDAQSVQQVCENVFAEVRAIEAELETVSASLGEDTDADTMDKTLARQAELLEEMEQRDGWLYQTHIDTVLNKLGFTGEHRTLPVRSLSGGWRNRAALAKILLEAPDVLLLDEPTNYMDLEGVEWLTEWLREFSGAFLLVSHDRQFLDGVVNRIVEVENYHLHEYPGDYTDYIRDKQFRYKTLTRQFEHEEELLVIEGESLKATRDRDRAEKQQKGGARVERKLADIKKRVEPRPVEQLITSIYANLRVKDNLLRVESVTKGYNGLPLFENISFELHGEERVAIVGRNGSGKSTLLRLVTGEEKPDAGRVAWEPGVEWVSFNQQITALPPGDTVTHAVNVTGMAFNAPRKQVDRFLTLLRFSEMDQKQRIGTLSGGQRARVALAQCLLSGASVILLDEPTNHLDVPSIQVMERALIYFPGAVLFVSHDRHFLDQVATRQITFTETGVHVEGT